MNAVAEALARANANREARTRSQRATAEQVRAALSPRMERHLDALKAAFNAKLTYLRTPTLVQGNAMLHELDLLAEAPQPRRDRV